MPHTSALGKKGEDQAVEFLEKAGIKIISKNFRSKYGEIDIIAIDKEAIVFIEVKAWSAFGFENLQYGLDTRKQHKIIKTAKYFLFENRKYSNMAIRFDVIFVNTRYQISPENQINHLVSAFTERV